MASNFVAHGEGLAGVIHKPKFVYFDLGNVLLFFDHSLAARSMAKVIGVDPDVIRRTVFDSQLQNGYERGERSTREFVAILEEQFGRPLCVDALKEAASDIFVPNANILPVLEKIRRMQIPMGLLSNTCEAHWEWILRMRYPQVLGWFDPIVLSYEVQRMKPEPEIYGVATELAGVAPVDIFFTDDRIENVEGAIAAGWQASVFTSADRLMDLVTGWESPGEV
jgi:FMN phosphatase YigB (HAD superfamily)